MSRSKPLQMFDPVDPSGPVRDLPVTRAVNANERPLQMFEPVDSSVQTDLPETSAVALPEAPLQMFDPEDPVNDLALLDQLIRRLGVEAVRRRVERHARPTP